MLSAEQIYDEYVSGDRDKVAAAIRALPPLQCAVVCVDLYRFLMMERSVTKPGCFIDWLRRQAVEGSA